MTAQSASDRSNHTEESKVRALYAIARGNRSSLVNRGLVFGLGLVALDALAVARFQPETALAIVRHTPPLTLLVGVMLNLMPVIAKVVIGLLLLFAIHQLHDFSNLSGLGTVLAAVVALVVSNAVLDERLAMSPLQFAVLAGASVLVVYVLISVQERVDVPVLLVTAVLLMVAITVLDTWMTPEVREAIARPYVPEERISVEGGEEDIIGYVLDVDRYWTTVMADSTRDVLLLPSDSVIGRAVCRDADNDPPTPRWPLVEPPATRANVPC